MARRVTLPSAEDLFRPTEDAVPAAGPDVRRGAVRVVPDRTELRPSQPPEPDEPERPAGASGRIRHDEKMTVYVTSDELLAIEQARLTLRRDHGLAVDRGRLTREALHLALEGLDADGGASALVRRLTEES